MRGLHEWFEPIKKSCPRCNYRLHEACNGVRMCLYCDWLESDEAREARLGRARTQTLASGATTRKNQQTKI